jgi:hypothetical protein
MELDGDTARQGIEPALEDAHPRVRDTAARLLNQLVMFSTHAKIDRLTAAQGSAPRAQSATLKLLLAENPPKEFTRELIEAKVIEVQQLHEASLIVKHAASHSGLAALNVLALLLGERVAETVDLTLLALQGSEDTDAIELIRVGMKSHEKQIKASACEALSGLENRRVGKVLSSIIESPGQSKSNGFKDLEQVLEWCLKRNDRWLCECAQACTTATSP